MVEVGSYPSGNDTELAQAAAGGYGDRLRVGGGRRGVALTRRAGWLLVDDSDAEQAAAILSRRAHASRNEHR